ncbi:hypothetical protein SAMN06309944_0702 [Micrococcales bacterium KH10]|nr:hypothetical protein SAMN06309944_0702 [Micrococcales bacterium KH10]
MSLLHSRRPVVVATVVIAAITIVVASITIIGAQHDRPDSNGEPVSEPAPSSTEPGKNTTAQVPKDEADDPVTTAQARQQAQDLSDAGMFSAQPGAATVDPAVLSTIEAAARDFFDIDPVRDRSIFDALDKVAERMTPVAAERARTTNDLISAHLDVMFTALADDPALIRPVDVVDAGRPFGTPADTENKVTRSVAVTWELVTETGWVRGQASDIFTYVLIRDGQRWLIEDHDMVLRIPARAHGSISAVEGE